MLDCHPPSNRRMKLSPISAIRLPCRRTCATSSVWVTLVLALCQSVPLVMAAFMRRSIFRMFGCCAVDFLKIQRIEALCQKSGQLGLWHTEDQISDGIGVRIAAAPLDRMTRGQTPDHAGFSPHLPDAIGAVDACRVLCPVLIKCGPGGGLDCKHGLGVVGVIVARRGATPQSSSNSAPIVQGLMAGSSQRTPSPVVTRWRPICPLVMQRTNFHQGDSSSAANSTHALAVLYRNSSF